MSKVKLERVARDFYPSPSKLVRAWLDDIDNHPVLVGTFLEPCDGEGAISDELRAYGMEGEATDIQDGSEYDATTEEYWEDRSPDWVITNPPFNLATPILRQAIKHSTKGVIMILRASYLEPCKDRRDVLALGQAYISYVNPRPRFRADTKGSDNTTVIFATWLKDGSQTTKINYLTDWHKDKTDVK